MFQLVSRAAFWSIGSITISRIVFYLTSIFVLALLTPAEFASVAIAISFYQGINIFLAIGMEARALSMTDSNERYRAYPTLFYLELLRGGAVSLVVVFASFHDHFASYESLPEALRWIGLSSVIFSLKNPSLVESKFRMNMAPVFYCEVSQSIVSASVVIFGILLTGDALYFTIGYFCGAVAYVLLSYLVLPRISLNRFDGRTAKTFFVFGGWLSFSSALNALIEHGVTIMVSFFNRPALVSTFERSDFLLRKSTLQVGEIGWRVLLPLFSKVDMSSQSGLKVLYASKAVLMTLGTIVASVAAIWGPTIVGKYFESWSPLLDSVMLFLVIGLISLATTVNSIYFQAHRVPSYESCLQLLRVFIVGGGFGYVWLGYAELSLFNLAMILLYGIVFYAIASHVFLSRLVSVRFWVFICPEILAVTALGVFGCAGSLPFWELFIATSICILIHALLLVYLLKLLRIHLAQLELL